MQHTLIPQADRQRFHREYYTRVLIVSLCILSVAILFGAGALFPAYIKAWIGHRSAENSIVAANAAKGDSVLDKANSELVKDSVLVDALSADLDKSDFSDTIRSLISVRGNTSITTFNVSRAGSRDINIGISGTSPTRDDLIAFKSRLESLVPGTKVDLPIEQLARSTNVPFAFQFVQHLP